MFVFDLIYNIILLLYLVATFSTIILQGLAIWTWWWFGFLTTRDWNLFCYFCCCIFHIKYFFLCVWICNSTLWLNVILYCLHMYFLWLNFSVLLAKVWSQYLQQRSSSMCSCIRVREAHKSLHFLKLNCAAPDKVVFKKIILLKSFLFCSLSSSRSMFCTARTYITAESTV